MGKTVRGVGEEAGERRSGRTEWGRRRRGEGKRGGAGNPGRKAGKKGSCRSAGRGASGRHQSKRRGKPRGRRFRSAPGAGRVAPAPAVPRGHDSPSLRAAGKSRRKNFARGSGGVPDAEDNRIRRAFPRAPGSLLSPFFLGGRGVVRRIGLPFLSARAGLLFPLSFFSTLWDPGRRQEPGRWRPVAGIHFRRQAKCPPCKSRDRTACPELTGEGVTWAGEKQKQKNKKF